MNKTKLAKAIALISAGMALSASASATVTTMYNVSIGVDGSNIAGTVDPTSGGAWNASYTGNTDGWANGAGAQTLATTTTPSLSGWTDPVSGTFYPATARTPVGYYATQNWVGTAGSTTAAFGYDGAHMNWGFEISGGNGGTGTISTFDSYNRYGVYADIDTAKGAWAATNTGAQQAGWRHDLDTGLFKSDTTGQVTVTVTGLLNPNAQFGFTVFHGMDHMTGYLHHVPWNAGNNTAGVTVQTSPYEAGGPTNAGVNSGTGLDLSDVVAFSVGALDGGVTPMSNTITFNAVAGEYYTIFLGGYMGGNWSSTTDGYSLTISQVPVPGAAWLFASAMTGFIGFGRRKAVAA